MEARKHLGNGEEEAVDEYLTAELILGLETDSKRIGRVVERTQGLNGQSIGRAHQNPFVDGEGCQLGALSE
eukprot:5470128-Ditylum_brightwellii.AAC.1